MFGAVLNGASKLMGGAVLAMALVNGLAASKCCVLLIFRVRGAADHLHVCVIVCE